MSMEALSAIGLVVLIIIGVLMITLLTYAIRLLVLIYSFFGNKDERNVEGEIVQEGKMSKLGKFITSASVIEIILFLLKSRGRFKR